MAGGLSTHGSASELLLGHCQDKQGMCQWTLGSVQAHIYRCPLCEVAGVGWAPRPCHQLVGLQQGAANGLCRAPGWLQVQHWTGRHTAVRNTMRLTCLSMQQWGQGSVNLSLHLSACKV